jgi:hypothetical protein
MKQNMIQNMNVLLYLTTKIWNKIWMYFYIWQIKYETKYECIVISDKQNIKQNMNVLLYLTNKIWNKIWVYFYIWQTKYTTKYECIVISDKQNMKQNMNVLLYLTNPKQMWCAIRSKASGHHESKVNETGDKCRSNNEEGSYYHCCSGKAINITQPECVFVALGIKYAMGMRHIVICGVPLSTIFFHSLS